MRERTPGRVSNRARRAAATRIIACLVSLVPALPRTVDVRPIASISIYIDACPFTMWIASSARGVRTTRARRPRSRTAPSARTRSPCEGGWRVAVRARRDAESRDHLPAARGRARRKWRPAVLQWRRGSNRGIARRGDSLSRARHDATRATSLQAATAWGEAAAYVDRAILLGGAAPARRPRRRRGCTVEACVRGRRRATGRGMCGPGGSSSDARLRGAREVSPDAVTVECQNAGLRRGLQVRRSQIVGHLGGASTARGGDAAVHREGGASRWSARRRCVASKGRRDGRAFPTTTDPSAAAEPLARDEVRGVSSRSDHQRMRDCDDCDDSSGGASTVAFVSGGARRRAARCARHDTRVHVAKAAARAPYKALPGQRRRRGRAQTRGCVASARGRRRCRGAVKSHLWLAARRRAATTVRDRRAQKGFERKHADSCWVPAAVEHVRVRLR